MAAAAAPSSNSAAAISSSNSHCHDSQNSHDSQKQPALQIRNPPQAIQSAEGDQDENDRRLPGVTVERRGWMGWEGGDLL
jgi:hypothetical protein